MATLSNMRAGDLWIVRLSEHLSDQIGQWVKTLESPDLWSTGMQILRSADSVTANIVEGYGRSRAADKLRFYHMSRGSLEETLGWIRKARNRGLIDYSQGSKLLANYWRLSDSLQAFIRSHKIRNNI